ncbi:hypothetical protein [Caulobacter vibrioides]|uniref:Transmembrane Fragile-X-F protein n=1 Tax=Caulobacter phage S2B TaxID=2759120 RepID=A0AAE7SXJ0_9CAUD|nr:hypothetical protein [Caulobacter vibrioides]QOC54160.1 hypothetical protein [Caulobacter phage S2B]QXZ53888.1 hypothetical protein KZH45_09545 [Caulobacter vibrioides]
MKIGLITLLTVLFVALKLTHVIAWSWLWVLAPLWIGIPLVVLFFVALAVLAALAR